MCLTASSVFCHIGRHPCLFFMHSIAVKSAPPTPEFYLSLCYREHYGVLPSGRQAVARIERMKQIERGGKDIADRGQKQTNATAAGITIASVQCETSSILRQFASGIRRRRPAGVHPRNEPAPCCSPLVSDCHLVSSIGNWGGPFLRAMVLGR